MIKPTKGNHEPMLKTKKRLLITLIVLTIIASGLWCVHCIIYKIPKTRIGLNENYSEMPEDSFHHYINLPIDNYQPTKELFRGYYLFSPNFYKSKNITFLLTDGQMELVSTKTDFEFFENVLRGSAYVLIGVRGHSPLLFPEVYKDGKVDYDKALQLFNSDQQVEDIEWVRLDLIKKGILKTDDKINLFGASGAGVLAQQYLSKYGKNVKRVILESTGAPDLAKQFGLKYSPNFEEFNPQGAKILSQILSKKTIDKQKLSNILFQIGRTEKSPKEAQIKLLEKLQNGGSLFWYNFKPITNLTLLNYMTKSPSEIMARVRWFELVGYDLMKYNSEKETNLLYELSTKAVSDLLEYHRNNNISPKQFNIKRSEFPGEVLILKGREDVVFSDEINNKMQRAYPNAKLLFFKDGHRMQNNKEKYYNIRNAFLNEGINSDKFKKLIDE
jgi:pimeloyl-ACP methyl ester carboxylesterase